MKGDTNWLLSDAKVLDAERKDWWRRLPEPALAKRQLNDPSQYDPPPGLFDALNAALILGQPLLLTGDPGCGKTEAAHYLAWRLGLDHGAETRGGDAARRFDIKSTTTAKDLFYNYDVIGRFYAAQLHEDTSPVRFLTLNALGRAIMEASEEPQAEALRARLLPDAGSEARRSVVLIDEIDKAPRDVPNDLLVEFEKLRFYVPEIEQTFAASARNRPIVVLTSNRERELPDAFLRRCIVFSVPFPDHDTLRKIVGLRIEGVAPALAEDAATLTGKLRTTPNLRRKPGTAELLSFIAAVQGAGLAAAAGLKAHDGWQQIARTTLLKNALDHDAMQDADLKALVR